MLWVGGGILVHGLEELGVAEIVPHTIHDVALAAAEAAGSVGPIVEWAVGAVGAAIVGAVLGGIIALIVRRFTKHPEELIVD
jgi:predicted DNA repair protein MutK